MKRIGVVVLVLAFVLGGCRACAKVAANCHGTEDCTVRGACGGDLVSGSGCAVVSASDCRASTECKTEGKCAFEASFSPKCVALRTRDCQTSTACRTRGRCSPSAWGACEVTDLGCRQSDGCASSNLCSYGRISHRVQLLDNEVCVATTTSQTDWCTQACDNIGACTRDGTKCIADDAAKCRASGMCFVGGNCSLDPESRSCVPASDDDCKASKGCHDYGVCRRVPGGDFCVGATRDE